MEVEKQVLATIKLQNDLEAEEREIQLDPKVAAFFKRQKEVQTQIADFWKAIETEMISKDIKTVKGDWGYITIAERQGWDVNEDQLPNKFFKKVVDTKRITDTYRLEGKAPKGCTPHTTKYLTKHIKEA